MPASIHRYMSGTVLPSVLCRFRVAHLLRIIVQPADGEWGLPACCLLLCNFWQWHSITEAHC